MTKKLKNSEVIQLYHIQVDRIKHEGNLLWVRFSAYFVLFAALSIGFVNGLSGESSTKMFSEPTIRKLILIAGTITSLAWFLTNINGAAWQEYFTNEVKILENTYQILPKVYTKHFGAPWTKLDVISVAISFSLLSWAFWIFNSFKYSTSMGLISLGISLLFMLFTLLITWLLAIFT